MARSLLSLLCIATLSLLVASTGRADLVTTVDGSTLNGRIEKIDGGVVYLATDFAGTLEIEQDQVASFTTDEPVVVRTGEKTTISGPATQGGAANTVVVANSEGEVTAPVSDIEAAWRPGQPDPEVAAKQAEIDALQRKWRYELGLDMTGKSGNSEEFGTALNANAVLEGPDDRLRFYGSYERVETDEVKTSDELIGGGEYTSFFHPRWGWYVRGELEQDEIEGIDFRATTASGITYRFINEPDHKLEGRTGLSYRYEQYVDGTTSDNIGLDFGVYHNWKFAEWGRMRNELTYVPAISDFADYRATHDSSVDMPLGLSDYWRLRFGISNEYNSQPLGNREKLDTTWYTRLVFSWE